jgi:predicted phage gp36 major capsid-like protein
MGGLFGGKQKPAPIPQEDPEVKRLRQQEAERAERERITATQQQLQLETTFRNRALSTAGLRLSRRSQLTSLLGSG